MKYLKKVPERIHEKTVVRDVVCDICNQCLENSRDGLYDCSNVTFEARIGSYYPEADCRTYYNMDICKECFLAKVLPFFQKLGKVHEEYGEFFEGVYD